MTDNHHILPSDAERTPGPNKYMLPPLLGKEHHDPRRRIQPAFTIRGRRRAEKVTVQPSPQQFQTENMTRYGNKETGRVLPVLKGKFSTPAPRQSPAPTYDVTLGNKLTFARTPAFSLGSRIKYVPPTAYVPGPKYGLPTLINNGTTVRCPAIKMLGRITDKKNSISPSPLSYGAVPLEKYRSKSAPKHIMLG